MVLIHTCAFDKYPLETLFSKLKTLGIKEIELANIHTQLLRTKTYCRLVNDVSNEYGIKTVAFFYDGLYFKPYSPNAEERKKTVEAIKTNIDLCSEMGAKIFTMAEGRLPEDVEANVGWNHLIEMFKEVSDYASGKGITIVDEYHPGMVASTVEKAPKLIDEVNSKAFKACLDFCHADAITDGSPEKLIKALGKRIGHVYIADSDGTRMAHLPLGYGRVNIEKCISEIKAYGYKGHWSLVLYLTPTPEWGVKQSLKALAKISL